MLLKPKRNNTKSSARRVAMDLLARREHAYQELQRKLLQRDFPSQEITPALDQLVADGLLSDARFAEAYVKMRSSRGFGPERITHELAERGVSSHLIAQSIDAMQLDWCELLRTVCQKKYQSALSTDFSIRGKQMQFLRYRGFSTTQINNAFTGG